MISNFVFTVLTDTTTSQDLKFRNWVFNLKTFKILFFSICFRNFQGEVGDLEKYSDERVWHSLWDLDSILDQSTLFHYGLFELWTTVYQEENDSNTKSIKEQNFDLFPNQKGSNISPFGTALGRLFSSSGVSLSLVLDWAIFETRYLIIQESLIWFWSVNIIL